VLDDFIVESRVVAQGDGWGVVAAGLQTT